MDGTARPHMAIYLFIAVFAGIASAMIATLAASSGGMGMFVSFVSPLPLMIAALGWHPLLALLGGALTSALLTEFFGWRNGLAFALTIMIPVYLLSRTIWDTERDKLVGAVVLISCWYGALAVLAMAFTISSDLQGYQDLIRKRLEFVLQSPAFKQFADQLPASGTPQAGKIADLMVQVMPILSATSLGLMYILNTWLATKITRKAGILTMDPVPGWTMRLPRFIVIAAVITLLASGLPGYVGFLAELLSNGTTIALTLLGYAAVHDVTRGTSGRAVVLTGLWAGTFLLAGIPALVMLLLGIGEIAFGWRDKMRSGQNS
jgi:Predicted membrane protein (DUF2232)